MTKGAPHDEGHVWQWECHSCGKVIPVGRAEQRAVQYIADMLAGRK
jgi:ribosomal protein S26